MTGIETALIIGGGLLAATGAVAGGVAANNQAKAEAKALKIQAGEQRAIAQREAIRKSREARLIISRQQALAAASGGSADDPTVLDLMQDTAEEGEYQKKVSLYEGESRSRQLLNKASVVRAQGRQAMLAGFLNAGQSVLSAGAQWAQYKPASTGSSSYTYG